MNCKQCGKQLHTNVPKDQGGYTFTGYCKLCVVHHKTKEQPKHEKDCPVCHRSFLAKRKGKIYCSPKCINEKFLVRSNTKVPKHPLLIAENGFPKKGEVRQCGFCSKEIYVLPCHLDKELSFCSRKHQHAFQKAKSKQVCKPCKICEVPICVSPSTWKYRPRSTCGRKCNKILIRRRTIERRKTYTKHQLDRLARYSAEAKEWRKKVFSRDDYTCQFCGVRGTYLEADHIKPWAYFPKLRYILSNGRTLCRPCHDTTKISAKEMKEIYGEPDM